MSLLRKRIDQANFDGYTVTGKELPPCTHCVIWLALWLARNLNAFHTLYKRCQQDFGLYTHYGLPNRTMNAHPKTDNADEDAIMQFNKLTRIWRL